MDIRLAASTTLLLAACAATPDPPGGPAVVHVPVAELPEPHAHADGSEPVAVPSAADGRADPATVAMRLVADGLAAQQLTVTDIGAEPASVGTSTAVVRVAATFTSPDGASHTAVYDVELHRRDGHRWTPDVNRPVR